MTTLRKSSSSSIPPDNLCGVSFFHPKWLQGCANIQWFMGIYSVLGTLQAMSHMYFLVTLTTVEKRFKIPSQTTGFILSGNEISQILLSLLLSYFGGQQNRPRWIAWGTVLCATSCFILALPHFIYGAGQENIELTEEYWENIEEAFGNRTDLLLGANMAEIQSLCGRTPEDQECNSTQHYLPLILFFLAQFFFGIGNSLYLSLGHTYLDDNTKKTNSPLILGIAFSLRMVGPIFGFVLGYFSLNTFIEPTNTPLIDKRDPRWLGAWWVGWMLIGSVFLLCSLPLGIFPKQLPKHQKRFHSEVPKVLRMKNIPEESSDTLTANELISKGSESNKIGFKSPPKLPSIKDFPEALMRLLKNKTLMFNNISTVFYILGTLGYMTFLSRYMEVQFFEISTILIGPLTIFGMVLGILISGFVITKTKPKTGVVLFWNVFVGLLYFMGQISSFFLFCDTDMSTFLQGNSLNTSLPCNLECDCNGVTYNPVCHSETGTTYYSPCHAGCYSWSNLYKRYENCTCLRDSNLLMTTTTMSTSSFEGVTNSSSDSFATHDHEDKFRMNENLIETNVNDSNFLRPGPCTSDCWSLYIFIAVALTINLLESSGKISNILVNYRAVSTEDKSFAQGLTLLMLSMFAYIPGPIIFGKLIDSSCMVWLDECESTGDCQFYDQAAFRFRINIASLTFTAIGVFFDSLVWYFGRNLDLYGEREAKRTEEIRRKNTAITPFITKNLKSNRNHD